MAKFAKSAKFTQSLSASKQHTSNVRYNNSYLSMFLLNNVQDNLIKIEQHFKVSFYHKGTDYKIVANSKKNLTNTLTLLDSLNIYITNEALAQQNLLQNFLSLKTGAEITEGGVDNNVIKTKRKVITLKTKLQIQYANAIDNHKVIFATGPAGGGKTYLAVAKAIEYLLTGKVERIIISRPIVDAGESLGYLPGDLKDKVDPYLVPIKDAMLEMLPAEFIEEITKRNQFEIAPIAFMRGRTFKNSFVILDEAQNATLSQLKMILTRLGENTKIVINGDLSQIDLDHKTPSGLKQCIEILKDIKDISLVEFTEKDIVRSEIVQKIVAAFSKHSK